MITFDRRRLKAYTQDIVLVVDNAPNYMDVRATFRGHQAGKIMGIIEGSRMLLSDFIVNNTVPIRYPFAHSILVSFFGCRRVDFRGMGLGRRIMQRFLEEAQLRGIQEIWGSITERDAKGTPYLLNFYRKIGFAIVQADSECLQNAKWKIILQNRCNASGKTPDYSRQKGMP